MKEITISPADLKIVATALNYRIENLTRLSEYCRRHNDSRAQWGYLQNRRKVQAVLDSILVQVPEMDIELFAL